MLVAVLCFCERPVLTCRSSASCFWTIEREYRIRKLRFSKTFRLPRPLVASEWWDRTPSLKVRCNRSFASMCRVHKNRPAAFGENTPHTFARVLKWIIQRRRSAAPDRSTTKVAATVSSLEKAILSFFNLTNGSRCRRRAGKGVKMY